MFAWIKSLFAPKQPVAPIPSDPPPPEFLWCLVGNFLNTRKQFSANTKVYCLSSGAGKGYDYIKIIALHKGSKRLICMIVSTKQLYNWRKMKVYSPQVISMLQQEHGTWSNPSTIDSLAEQFNNRT
jgi:hypothetical protein